MAHKNFQYAFNLHMTVNTNFRVMNVLPCECMVLYAYGIYEALCMDCVVFIGIV